MFGAMINSHLFQNEFVSDNLDVLKAEISVLRKQLQSKSEAITILKDDIMKLKTQVEENSGKEAEGKDPLSFSTFSIREKNTLSLYKALRKKYSAAMIELENTRIKYEDATEDLRIIRHENRQPRKVKESPSRLTGRKSEEDTLKQLENFKIQNSKLKLDIKALLDEKEDDREERSQLAEKIERLRLELTNLLRVDPHQHIDIDNLILENRSLLRETERLREEKDLANAMGRKYKEAWEASRLPVKRDSSADQQRLYALLDDVTFPVSHPVDLTRVDGLAGLSISLLETLQDRQMQMRHLRANNRNLAMQILLMKNEGKVQSTPSQTLLKQSETTESMDEIDFEKLCQDMNLTKKLDHTLMETKRVVVKVQSNPTISVKDYKEDYIRQRPEDDIRPENKDIPQLLSKTTASSSRRRQPREEQLGPGNYPNPGNHPSSGNHPVPVLHPVPDQPALPLYPAQTILPPDIISCSRNMEREPARPEEEDDLEILSINQL